MSDPNKARPRIGIIGGGTIAATLVEQIRVSGLAECHYVLVSSLNKTRSVDIPIELLTDDRERVSRSRVDLVVEAATPDVLADLAPRLLEHSSVCGFSCTALAKQATFDAIEAACAKAGTRFYVPHGAVLALDGLSDGRSAFESVIITTTKSGKSFGVDETASGTLYEGAARGACMRFPRNVNVHAAVALAGLGFDRTQSRIVAVPGKDKMEHHISVKGQGLEWDLHVSSRSLGGVTGSYTPLSAVGSVQRILVGAGIRIA